MPEQVVYVSQTKLFSPHCWLNYLLLPLSVIWLIKPLLIEYQLLYQYAVSLIILCLAFKFAYRHFQTGKPPVLSKIEVSEIHSSSRITAFGLFVCTKQNLVSTKKSQNDSLANRLILYPWQCSPSHYRLLCREIIRVQLSVSEQGRAYS